MRIRPITFDSNGTLRELDWSTCVHFPEAGKPVGLESIQVVRRELAERDIHIVAPGNSFDVSLVATKRLAYANVARYDTGPLILYEFGASVDLHGWVRQALLLDKVWGIVMPRIQRNLNVYNRGQRQFGDGILPTETITRTVEGLPAWFVKDSRKVVSPVPQLPPPVLEKRIQVVPGFPHCSIFRGGWEKLPDAKRCLDLLFMGTVVYKSWPITLHRVCCLRQMHIMRSTGQITGRSVEYGLRSLPRRDYLEKSRTAKAMPSPWGWGPSCFRDFECVMSGAILVKPDTSFCFGWPDLFNPADNLYVKCRMDFSDLPAVADHIAENWESPEYQDMRRRAFELVKSSMDPEATADRIAVAFHGLAANAG